MKTSSGIGLLLILLCMGFSIAFGGSVGNSMPGGVIGFQGVYYGTKCLLAGCDPYDRSQLQRFYQKEGGNLSAQSAQRDEAVTLYVNLPTTFLVVAPFAMLAWQPAHFIWLSATAGALFLGALLMYTRAARTGPAVALFLTLVVLANCEVSFATANTAGVVVGLCLIAAWCLLEDRFVATGVICLAISLAVKPHDSGLVWLYFLLSGGARRRRAVQALIVTAAMALVAFFWVSHVTPGWFHEMRANLTAISGPGGINDPGPGSVTGRTASMVIDLQGGLSMIRNDPRAYNLVSYLVCGSLLLVAFIKTLRTSYSPTMASLALAAIVPFTMLITYHRPYDAKLLLLAIPACAALWSEGKARGRLAFLVTAIAILATSDIPLVVSIELARHLQVTPVGFTGKLLTIVLTRPASLALFVMALFYLWVYISPRTMTDGGEFRTKVA